MSAAVVGAAKGLNGNSTRGLISGGNGNAIEYITIQTTGNFSDFGDLLFPLMVLTMLQDFASSVKSIAGGTNASGAGSGNTDAIGYVTTSTLGNSADFGDLTAARWHIWGHQMQLRAVFGMV